MNGKDLINIGIPHYYEGELSGSVNVCGADINNTPIEKISEQVGSIFQNPRSQFFCVDTESEIVFGCENMELIERCCTHILHIENGRIREELL